MAGAITVTGLESFKDQSGDLTLVSPDSAIVQLTTGGCTVVVEGQQYDL